MNSRGFWICFIVFLSCLPLLSAQVADAVPDPIKELSSSFPDTVRIKNKGRLLEFCPDGTCDGFVSSGKVGPSTLKDFAYLYVYFFSDYTFVDEWRAKPDAKNAADGILSKPAYHKCQNGISREAARCVLRDMSSGGKIKLIFVRYDEGERHALPKNLADRLSAK